MEFLTVSMSLLEQENADLKKQVKHWTQLYEILAGQRVPQGNEFLFKLHQDELLAMRERHNQREQTLQKQIHELNLELETSYKQLLDGQTALATCRSTMHDLQLELKRGITERNIMKEQLIEAEQEAKEAKEEAKEAKEAVQQIEQNYKALDEQIKQVYLSHQRNLSQLSQQLQAKQSQIHTLQLKLTLSYAHLEESPILDDSASQSSNLQKSRKKVASLSKELLTRITDKKRCKQKQAPRVSVFNECTPASWIGRRRGTLQVQGWSRGDFKQVETPCFEATHRRITIKR